ncbi:MAG TPA: pseudouridine synthase [Candidatus Limnocylindrales bacterium]|nr:pseudouridine synthase [Candidatus Limnocylindrales bacterium]
MEIRVQKLMAQANIASRRGAEALIEQGRVRINGQTAKLGDKADPEKDVVEVDGERLRIDTQRLIYLALYKPKNVLSTSEPHPGDDRRTVLDLVPNLGHLFTVGRLDADSEGLAILTNDGSLTQKLTHPSQRHSKEYRVTVEGWPSGNVLDEWQRGVYLGEDGRSAPCFVEVIHGARDQSVLRVIMIEGKKRQIRRIAAALGHPVIKLVRTHMGAFSVEGLKPGEYREMTAEEVKLLSIRAPETVGFRLRRLPKADDEYTPRPERPRDPEAEAKPRQERKPDDLQHTRRGTTNIDDKIDAQIARNEREAAEDGRPVRKFDDRSKRSYSSDRPQRSSYSDRPPRREGDRPQGDRPPRSYSSDRPQRSSYSDRPPRRDGDSRPPRREGDRPQGDRPPRSYSSDRPQRSSYSDRPPRREGDRPQGDRPLRSYSSDRPQRSSYSDRPPRRDGDSRPPRPAGDRPQGDRPPRSSYSDRPPRRDGDSRPPRPAGDRPQGDRPPRSYSSDRPQRSSYSDRPPRRDGDSRPPYRSSSHPSSGANRSYRPRGDQPPAAQTPRKKKDEDSDA